MTWAKLPPELASEAMRDGLSDAAFRLYIECVLWIYQLEEMSLVIPRHMLRRISGVDDPESAMGELVKRDYLHREGEDWMIWRHGGTIRQSLAVQSAKRKQDADRQRRYREQHRKPKGDVTP